MKSPLISITYEWPGLRTTSLVRCDVEVAAVPRIGEHVYIKNRLWGIDEKFTVADVTFVYIIDQDVQRLFGWERAASRLQNRIIVELTPVDPSHLRSPKSPVEASAP